MSEGQKGGFPELTGYFFYPEAELRGILLIKIFPGGNAIY
jgi:hypothetical protein